MKALAIYCGSATPEDPRYIDLARTVGTQLAHRGITVVYGGGKLGLMGAVSSAALAAGGKVIGVIPEALATSEIANSDCTSLHTVSGMHERKKMFTELSDGFITLPGGVGTMDELWEAISWAQLGYHEKPVGLLNTFGFFDHLIRFYRHMTQSGFIRPAHSDILITAETINDLLHNMEHYRPHTPIFAMQSGDL